MKWDGIIIGFTVIFVGITYWLQPFKISIDLKHQALEILGEEDTRDYWKEDKPYWENEKNKLKIN